jgi:type II secretory pathway pseudopilin PulG
MRICRRRNFAFTIVELLVAAAITVVIVVLLGGMFGSLTKTATRSNQSIDAFREARAALQMMTRDLRNLVRDQWQPDPFANPPPTTTQPVTEAAAFLALENLYHDPATGNQQVYALIATKNSGQGDLCSVGYYCRWNDQGYGYPLRRFFRNSTATYQALAAAPGYAADSVLYTPDALGTAAAAMRDEVLATNIWNLKLVAYDATGVPINISSGYVCDSSATTPVQVPAVLEISFRAMSAEAARTVISAQAPASVWMNDQDPQYVRLIKPHVYNFATRVKLQ